MPSPYEHLITAEDLLSRARELLDCDRPHSAAAHARVAAAFLQAADARQLLIPDLGDVPAARSEPWPEWCGTCEGPAPALRMVDVSTPGQGTRIAKCPNCHPGSPQYTPPSGSDGGGEFTPEQSAAHC